MYIGGIKLKRDEPCKYRPCNNRCISFCGSTFFSSLIALLIAFSTKENFVLIIVSGLIFLLNILFSLYSIFKLNSFVYLTNTCIKQKQYGKFIIINYEDITDVKLSLPLYVKAPYAIKIFNKKEKIMFEIPNDIFDKFMELCPNIKIKYKINYLINKDGVF